MLCCQGVVNIHVKLDPASKHIKSKNWLPEDVVNSVAMYLSLYHVHRQQDFQDSAEEVKRELAQLGLNDHEMKHTMFRTETHTKHFCRSLMTPRTMIQTGRFLLKRCSSSHLLHPISHHPLHLFQ